MRKIARRDFLKMTSAGILGFILLNGVLMLKKYAFLSGLPESRTINLSGKPDGTYFYDSFLVVKQGNQYRALSNKCTHAGCKISNRQGDHLVCACHGSVYSITGQVLKGPATHSLQQLEFTWDEQTGDITVKTPDNG